MTLDLSSYTHLPQLRVAETIALVHALLTAAKPLKSHSKVKSMLTALRASTQSLQDAFAAPEAKPTSNTREADTRMDRAWGALDARLEAALELDEATAQEAERVRGVLFPKGMMFLRDRYRAQWSEGEAIFARIESNHLAASIERLAGKPYLDLVRQRHHEYGAALGVTSTRVASATADLAEPLRQVREDLTAYVRVLTAFVLLGEVSTEHASAALVPFDQARSANRTRRASKSTPPPADPSAPLPPVE
ncbi:MAG: hypothetical protein Q8Q09_02265 [Deltaproteobacteria bacterium]|nr:hypothetical protein [Deltaproteobacteria bacterium]